MATSSSFSPEVYPYPVHVNVKDSVPTKLTGTNDYFEWREIFLDFLESHHLISFINGKVIEDPENISWKRSDELVQKWLRSTIQDDILLIVEHLKTALAIWRVLEDKEVRINMSHYLPLYKAVQKGDWERVKKFLEKEPDAIKARLNTSLQTPLMVAVKSSHRNKVVKGLLEKMSKEDPKQLEHGKDKTVLHKAVAAGNIEAAKMLVKMNPKLPYICGDSGNVPLRKAAHRGNREMVSYLLTVTEEDTDPRPFINKLGFNLIDSLIMGGLYDIALMLIRRHPELAIKDYSLLLNRMALQSSAFPSRLDLNFFQRFINSYVPTKLENSKKLEKQQCGGDIESPAQCSTPDVPTKLEKQQSLCSTPGSSSCHLIILIFVLWGNNIFLYNLL